MAAEKPYEPLDVANPGSFRRVKGPPPGEPDPNALDKQESPFDFDTDTLDGARKAMRPLAVLLWIGAAFRLILASTFLVRGDIGATLTGTADEAVWANTIDGLWLLLEAAAFAVTGAFAFIMHSRIAAGFGLLILIWLIYEKVGVILGWWGGSLIAGVIYIAFLAPAAVLALLASINVHRMQRLGVERLGVVTPDAGDQGSTP